MGSDSISRNGENKKGFTSRVNPFLYVLKLESTVQRL